VLDIWCYDDLAWYDAGSRIISSAMSSDEEHVEFGV
jgi:hypothetical protein